MNGGSRSDGSTSRLRPLRDSNSLAACSAPLSREENAHVARSQIEIDNVWGGALPMVSSSDEASTSATTWQGNSGCLSETASGSELETRRVERSVGRWGTSRDKSKEATACSPGRTSFAWTIGGGSDDPVYCGPVAAAASENAAVPMIKGLGNRTSEQSVQEALSFFAGLRVLSMLWVFIGHLAVFYVIFHRHDIAVSLLLDWFSNSVFGNLIFGATYAVDTFFFISGVLTALSTARILTTPTSGSTTGTVAAEKMISRSDTATALNDSNKPGDLSSNKEAATTSLRVKRTNSISSRFPSPGTVSRRFAALLVRRYFRLIGVILIYVLPPKIIAHLPRKQRSPGILAELEQGLLYGIQGGCYRFWWSNLVLLNNVFPKHAFECAGWMWYIANDWQFFVFGSLLTILALKRRRIGLIAAVVSLLASVSVALYIAYQLRLTTALNIALTHWELAEGRPHESEDGSKMFFWPLGSRFDALYYFYIAPWVRVHTHLVGLLVGFWILARQSDRGLQLHSKPTVVRSLSTLTLQAGAAACMLLVTLVPYIFGVSPRSTAGLIGGVVYTGLGRFAWSIALAILTVTAILNPERNILRWLGRSHWFFPSQLSYAFYHTHLSTILIFILPIILFFDITTFSLWSFLATVAPAVTIATFASSIVVHYYIERPVQQLGIRAAKLFEGPDNHPHSS